jgi:signal transduction histidine kinase/DNA-binding response OmpR family regulator
MRLAWLILLLAAALVGSKGQSAPLLTWDLQSFHDPHAEYSPEMIAEHDATLPWKTHKSLNLSFGYTADVIWLKLRLPPELVAQNTMILEMRHALLDEFHLYQYVNRQWTYQKAGARISRSDWPRDTAVPSFTLRPSERDYYLIRLQSATSLQVPLAIMKESDFENQRVWVSTLQAFYYGALLAITLYNFLVWTITGLQVYGYYVGFLVSYAFFQLSISGIGYSVLWPQSYQWTSPGLMIGALAGELCSSLFASKLLDINGRMNRWFVQYLSAAAVTVLALYVMGLRQIAYLGLMLLTIAPWICYLVWLGYEGVKRRERVAYWYVVAWLFFILGSTVTLLRSGGLVPNNMLTLHAQQIGSAIEFILLSFALADRIKTLQERVQEEHLRSLESERRAREADQRALVASQAALKEQTHLVALKDQFLANTSHELRTPLNSMIGLSENMLFQRELDARNREDVQHILVASKRLYQLVSNILDFSALQEESLMVESSDIKLKPIVQKVLEQFVEDAAAKAVSFDLSGLEQTIHGIQGDPYHVTTVIHSIVSNAVKFTTQGEISITYQEKDEWVQVAIRDTGIGIPADRLKNLEEHFVQADGSIARGYGGAGLGLALAHGLMKKLRGSIDIYSQPGVGTTVVLQFLRARNDLEDEEGVQLTQPVLKLAANEGWAGSSHRAASSRKPLKMVPAAQESGSLNQRQSVYRLLIVDDDVMNRAVLRNYLEGHPYLIREASSGQEALDLFYSEPNFDMVLLDVMMPGMTGYEVCRRLRKTHDISLMPVIMLTAKQQAQDIVEGFEAGANDYLLKPIHRDELFARMTTHLKVSKRSLAMKRFVPEDIIALLGHKDISDVQLGDAVEKKLAIVFADIRGFTGTMENMPPGETFNWLNRCYAILGPEIRRAQGFIDKYIGDAILALFPQGPEGAVQSAIAMQRGLAASSHYWLGMGIHTGPTMIGTLGEPERFEATVLSDAVNVASRIEMISKALEVRVIASEDLKQSLRNPNQWSWRCLGLFQLKGRNFPVTLYELLDAEPQIAKRKITLIDFENAVQQLIANRVTEALLLLEAILKVDSTDPVARFFYQKALQLKANPQDLSRGFIIADPQKLA